MQGCFFRSVLSFPVLGYLVYEGVAVTEDLEDLESMGDGASIRRQHLVVTAIREFILCLDTFEKVNYLSPMEKDELRLVKGKKENDVVFD